MISDDIGCAVSANGTLTIFTGATHPVRDKISKHDKCLVIRVIFLYEIFIFYLINTGFGSNGIRCPADAGSLLALGVKEPKREINKPPALAVQCSGIFS